MGKQCAIANIGTLAGKYNTMEKEEYIRHYGGSFVKDYLLQFIVNIPVLLIAFFIGYKLRKFVPKERRLFVAFIIATSILALSLIIAVALAFPYPTGPFQTAPMAIAIGLSVGLVSTNDSK